MRTVPVDVGEVIRCCCMLFSELLIFVIYSCSNKQLSFTFRSTSSYRILTWHFVQLMRNCKQEFFC